MKKNEAYDVFYTLRDNLGLSGQGWDPVVPEENEQDRRRVSWSVKLVKKRNLGQAFNIPRIVSKVVAEHDLLMKVDATDERPTLRLVSAEYEVRELTGEEAHRKRMSGQLRAVLNYKARALFALSSSHLLISVGSVPYIPNLSLGKRAGFCIATYDLYIMYSTLDGIESPVSGFSRYLAATVH